jgi:hypothetical protein
MKTIIYAIACLTMVLCTMCTLNIRPSTGGASETVNASIIIQDTVIEIQTTAEEDFEMEVFIINDSYSPLNKAGILDSTGIFNSSGISNLNALKKSNTPGIYNIFLINRDSLLSCSFLQIPLFKCVNDTLTDTFSTPGTIKGSVTVSQKEVPVLVYLRGTPFFKQLNDDYRYTFYNVPKGTYIIVAEVVNRQKVDAEFNSKGESTSPRQASRAISLESGDSIDGIDLRLSN